MTEDINYSELVDGTIAEIKERVDQGGLDLEQVLAAEKANKDRVTLVDWLEDRIEETDDTGDEEPASTEEPAVQMEDSGSTAMSVPLQDRWAMLGAGVLVGLLIAATVFMTGMVSPAAGQGLAATGDASDRLDTYLADNKEALQLPPEAELSVESVEPYEDSGLYEATLHVGMTLQNQTIDQNVSAFTTQDGKYVFFGTPPLDTTQSVEDQLPEPPQ